MAHVRQPERQTHSQRDREGDLVGKNSSWFVTTAATPSVLLATSTVAAYVVHGPQVSFTLRVKHFGELSWMVALYTITWCVSIARQMLLLFFTFLPL